MSSTNRPTQLLDNNGAIIPHQNDDDQYVGYYTSATVRYHGYARPGITKDQANWKLFRETLGSSTFDSGSTIAVEFANATKDYANIIDDSVAVSISSIDDASPAEVTTSAAHGYTTGKVVGITDTDVSDLDDHYFTIIVVNTTKFTIGTDRTGLATPATGNSYARSFANASYS